MWGAVSEYYGLPEQLRTRRLYLSLVFLNTLLCRVVVFCESRKTASTPAVDKLLQWDTMFEEQYATFQNAKTP